MSRSYTTPEYKGVAHAVVAAELGSSVQAYDAATMKTNVAVERTASHNFDMTALTSTTGHIAWNLAANEVARHVATEDTVLDNPTNMKAGGVYRFIFVQHASSAKTLGFGDAYKWPGGTAPTISVGASAIDVLTFVCDGTSMLGIADQAFATPA